MCDLSFSAVTDNPEQFTALWSTSIQAFFDLLLKQEDGMCMQNMHAFLYLENEYRLFICIISLSVQFNTDFVIFLFEIFPYSFISIF